MPTTSRMTHPPTHTYTLVTQNYYAAVMLLDLANRQLSLLHTSHSIRPKNKDHNNMQMPAL